MTTTLDQLVVKLSADISGLKSQLSQANGEVNRFNSNTRAQARGTQDAIDGLTRKVGQFLAVWAAYKGARAIIEAGMELQSLQNRMIAATGNANVAAEAFAFVRAEANRLGLDVRATAEGFGGFAASALRAGLTFKQTKDIFTGVSEAAVSMRLNSEQTKLVFKALEQIAGKGTVSMEELRGQLGDALPGAFEIAAKSMGKTTAEFNKMVANGEVLAADFLPRFGEAIRKELGGSVDEASQSAQAAFNRLGNAFFDLKNQLAQGGFMDAVTKGVQDLTAALNDPQTQQGLKDFAILLGEIATRAVEAAAAIGRFFGQAADRKAAIQELTAMGRSATPENVADMVNTIQLRRQAINAPFSGVSAPTSSQNGSYTLGTVQNAPVAAAAQHAADARNALRERVQAMGMGFVSETDPNKLGSAQAVASLNKRYAEEQDLLEKALKKKAITQQEFNELNLKAELDYNTRMAALHKEYRDEFLSDQQAFAEGFLGVQLGMQQKSLSDQGKSFRQSIDQAAQHNKVFFELSKAAALAQALLSARQSVVDAYAFGTKLGGPALGAVFAGVAAAAQAANIAAIASTTFNGGSSSVGSTGGSASGGAENSVSTSGNGSSQQKSIYIDLHGDDQVFYTKNNVRKLIDAINDAVGDGTRLAVSS